MAPGITLDLALVLTMGLGLGAAIAARRLRAQAASRAEGGQARLAAAGTPRPDSGEPPALLSHADLALELLARGIAPERVARASGITRGELELLRGLVRDDA